MIEFDEGDRVLIRIQGISLRRWAFIVEHLRFYTRKSLHPLEMDLEQE